MARLPIPGKDSGTWGDILNDYLAQAHKSDGTLKADSVTATQIQDGTITESQLDSAAQTKLNATAPVTSVSSKTGDVTLAKADVGLGNVDNTSDVNKPVSTAVQTALNNKNNLAAAATGELCARMTVRPTIARRTLIENLISSLITAGIWNKLDGFYVLAAHDTQAAKLNWIGGMQDITAVNSPTFQIDRGYTGDGSSSYLDTNTSAAVLEKFTANDASLGVYTRSDIASGSMIDIGKTGGGTYLAVSNASNGTFARLNYNSSSAVTISNAGSRTGLFAWTRDASNAYVYRAGSSLGSASIPTGSLSGGNMTILKVDSSYSTRQISAAFISSGLSNTEHAALNTALTTYLTAIGAAV